jgi:lipoprotein-anchoring transpeptidase ErfK/SrfK
MVDLSKQFELDKLERGQEWQLFSEAIEKANNEGREPLKTTKLGGGIGIHGWSGNWPESDRQNLTWGCVSMEQAELEALYIKVNKGCVVLIYP